MGVGLWIDLLHRGGGSSRGMPRDNFRSTGASLSDGSGRGGSSITTKQFLWVKIAAVLVYAVEILVAIGLRNNNQYQKWRPGPFLAVSLVVGPAGRQVYNHRKKYDLHIVPQEIDC